MKLLADEDQFDNWQSYFSYELLKSIKEQLDAAGVPAEQTQELTTSIGFSVSCLLDASADFTIEGKTIKPYLTFSAEDGVLVHQGSPSHLHECVYGNADELFGE